METTMTFREEIEQQAQVARRAMVRSGELLTSSEFCRRLGVSERRLARMMATGSVFAIEVDGVCYFPTLLANPSLNRKRLQSVCRILVPAPANCRLHYLSSRRDNLGAITPLEALADDRSYRRLRRMAHAYAAEWSRTVVHISAAHSRPDELESTYVAAIDVDPRINLWKRAREAMKAGGYIAPPPPYPIADVATVVITRSDTGNLNDVEEARLDVRIADDEARVVIYATDVGQRLQEVSIVGAGSIVEAVRRIIEAFCHLKMG
jgi:hypothetical protein